MNTIILTYESGDEYTYFIILNGEYLQIGTNILYYHCYFLASIVYFMDMIDATDRKIILALQKNGRLSNASLAHIAGVSTSTVAKRVEHLLESDTIRIRAVPNPRKLGYYADAFITMDVDLLKIDEICAQLKPIFNVNFIHTCFGRFDILLIVFFPTWEILHSFVKDRLAHIEGVRHIETFSFKDIVKRLENIFSEPEQKSPAVPRDELDFQLMNELVIDGTASYKNLASKTGASIPTIARRITNLLNKGVIKIIALPNPSRVGYIHGAVVGIRVQTGKIENICQQLAKKKEVHFVFTLINGFDILIGIHSSTPEEMYYFIKNFLAHIDGIIDIETFIRAEIQKRYYGWMLED